MLDENTSIKDQLPNLFATFARMPLRQRVTANGEIVWPAVPALLHSYVESAATIFALLGRPLEAKELVAFRQALHQTLVHAFSISPDSKIRLVYSNEPTSLHKMNCTLSYAVNTMEDEYHYWLEYRQPPLFGTHADAKVMKLARLLGDPKSVAILDVGAGTGRNAIPLAREGFQVGAVEIVRKLVDVLEAEAERDGIKVEVFVGDAFEPELGIPEGHYNLVVLAEVVASHFRNREQLRTMFERATAWLASDGLLVFSCFLSDPGYVPSAIDRELSEAAWCPIFGRDDLEATVAGLPLTLVSDESVHDFEKEHLESSSWPPTPWFENWVTGRNIFDTVYHAERPPFEMRWIVYKRDPSPRSFG